MSTFSVTYAARSYKPNDHTGYTAGGKSGQIMGIYFPNGSPGDYLDVNGRNATSWPIMVCYRFTGFSSSDGTYSNGTADDITSSVGFPWQCLMRGIAVAMVQVSSPAVDNAGGTVPTGNGYFHAPGGTAGYYESRNRPGCFKDAEMALQHIKYHAATIVDANGVPLRPTSVGVSGISAGGTIAGWNALAPNRAWGLGSYGQYLMSTVPNVYLSGLLPVMWWDRYANGNGEVSAALFPRAESGTGDDTLAGSLAATNAAPQRYRRAASGLSWISQLGTDCIAPTYLVGGTAPVNANIGFPITEDVETDAHSIWHMLALRNMMPRGRVELRLDSSIIADAVTAGMTTDMYDAAHPRLGDLDQYGQDGSDSGPEIDYAIAHINDLPWDQVIPSGGIVRRGQVNETGRFAVPKTDGRGGILVKCARGGMDLLLSDTPYNNGARGRLKPGESKMVYGDGPLWLAATSGGNGVAVFEACEIAKGEI